MVLPGHENMLYKNQHVCVTISLFSAVLEELSQIAWCYSGYKTLRQQIKDSYSGIIWNKIIIIRWSSPHSVAENNASVWNGTRLYYALLFTLSEIEHYIRFNEKVYFSFVYKCENGVVSIIVFSFLFVVCYFDFAQSNFFWAKKLFFLSGNENRD